MIDAGMRFANQSPHGIGLPQSTRPGKGKSHRKLKLIMKVKIPRSSSWSRLPGTAHLGTWILQAVLLVVAQLARTVLSALTILLLLFGGRSFDRDVVLFARHNKQHFSGFIVSA